MCVCVGGGSRGSKLGLNKTEQIEALSFYEHPVPGDLIIQRRLWRGKGWTSTAIPSLTKCVLVVTAQRKAAVCVTPNESPRPSRGSLPSKTCLLSKRCFGRASCGGAFSTDCVVSSKRPDIPTYCATASTQQSNQLYVFLQRDQ